MDGEFEVVREENAGLNSIVFSHAWCNGTIKVWSRAGHSFGDAMDWETKYLVDSMNRNRADGNRMNRKRQIFQRAIALGGLSDDLYKPAKPLAEDPYDQCARLQTKGILPWLMLKRSNVADNANNVEMKGKFLTRLDTMIASYLQMAHDGWQASLDATSWFGWVTAGGDSVGSQVVGGYFDSRQIVNSYPQLYNAWVLVFGSGESASRGFSSARARIIDWVRVLFYICHRNSGDVLLKSWAHGIFANFLRQVAIGAEMYVGIIFLGSSMPQEPLRRLRTYTGTIVSLLRATF